MSPETVDEVLKVGQWVGFIAFLAAIPLGALHIAVGAAFVLFFGGAVVTIASTVLLDRRKKRRTAQAGTVSSR